MKTLLLIIILVSTSCIKADNVDQGTASIPCDNSKSVKSVWETGDGSWAFDFTGMNYGDLVEVNFGDPVTYFDGSTTHTVSCYPPRGDLMMVVSENNRVEFRPCSNDSTLAFASYSTACNILTLKYDSDGSTESYL